MVKLFEKVTMLVGSKFRKTASFTAAGAEPWILKFVAVKTLFPVTVV